MIKRQGSGVRETFTVRKQSFGVGVERTFPVHSPKIERIEVASRGDVRRAKLYYLRGRVGRRARVRERQYTGPEAALLAEEPVMMDAEGTQEEAEPVDLGEQPDAGEGEAKAGEVGRAGRASPRATEPQAEGETEPEAESREASPEEPQRARPRPRAPGPRTKSPEVVRPRQGEEGEERQRLAARAGDDRRRRARPRARRSRRSSSSPSGSRRSRWCPTLEVNQRVLVDRVSYRFSDPDRRHRGLQAAAGRRPEHLRRRSIRTTSRARRRRRRSRTRTSSSGWSACPATGSACRGGRVYIDGRAQGRRRCAALQDMCNLQFGETDHHPARSLLHDGRQPWGVRRQPGMGPRPQEVDHREGLRHLLASQPDRHPLAARRAGARAPNPGRRSARGRPKRSGRRLFAFDRQFGYRFVAGADEAGRGCLAGPLFAAAVLFDLERLTLVGPARARAAQRLEAAHRGRAARSSTRSSCARRRRR